MSTARQAPPAADPASAQVKAGEPASAQVKAAEPASAQAEAPPIQPSLPDIFRCFLRVGATAYGGPAMLPLMREHILKRGWLNDEGFKVGMALCQAIPGGTLMQMAAYTGLVLRGLPGALAGFL
ncbi:MAG: chromate transporter, partial [Humidesulfovibrio sp.]|nr:chromate transporter [Humidesulfovibrio sp.]